MLGAPTDAQVGELQSLVANSIEPFGLRLGREVAWSVHPANFNPDQLKASVAVFFGGRGGRRGYTLIRDLIFSNRLFISSSLDIFDFIRVTCLFQTNI
mgnify:CR=1 FL=1